MASSNDCDLMQAVITCEGDFHDPEFHLKFGRFLRKLKSVLCPVDKQRKLRVRRVEPWNSVRVTFTLPREAAVRLRQLAQVGDEVLRELGVLSVQLEGDQVISLTIAGRFSEPQEIVFRTDSNGQAAESIAGSPVSSKVTSADPVPVQNKSVVEILSQAVGMLSSAASEHSAENHASLATFNNGVNPKPGIVVPPIAAAPNASFLSPNVVAPVHQPVPFVPSSRPPTNNTYPFASMVHAAQTAQSASLGHAQAMTARATAPSNVRTSSPITLAPGSSSGGNSSSCASTTVPLHPDSSLPTSAASPKPMDRNGLSNSLLVNLLQCDQSVSSKPPPAPAVKSVIPSSADSNLTLAASVTVVNVRTGVTVPNLSNLANGGPLAHGEAITQLEKRPPVASTSAVHSVGLKPNPAPSNSENHRVGQSQLPFIPGGATVTAVLGLPPISMSSIASNLNQTTSAPVTTSMAQPLNSNNLLDGMVCVNDTYMLPGRNNLSITVVSDPNRTRMPGLMTTGPGNTSTGLAGEGSPHNPSLQAAKREVGKSSRVLANSPSLSNNNVLVPPEIQQGECSSNSSSSSSGSENEHEGAGSPTTVLSLNPSGHEDIVTPAEGTLDNPNCVGGERIKLRLRLEKSCEPVTTMTAYKVEKAVPTSPISLLRKAERAGVKTAPASAGCHSSPSLSPASSSTELRVPPLHISLKGRNATLLSPRSTGAGLNNLTAEEGNSGDEDAKPKRKIKSKSMRIIGDETERKPFKRKKSLPLVESEPEDDKMELVVVEAEEGAEPKPKVARLCLEPFENFHSDSSPEHKLDSCEFKPLVVPELSSARLGPATSQKTSASTETLPTVANLVVVTSLADMVSEKDVSMELKRCPSLGRSQYHHPLNSSIQTKAKEEPLLKVSVLNNVQKQANSLHRDVRGFELPETEKEDKGGGVILDKSTQEKEEKLRTVLLENQACKEEPVNTQGEDSGIESMDALSEKSPNQSESPSRREDREPDYSKPEILSSGPTYEPLRVLPVAVELNSLPKDLATCPSPVKISLLEDLPVSPALETPPTETSADIAVILVNGTGEKDLEPVSSPCPEITPIHKEESCIVSQEILQVFPVKHEKRPCPELVENPELPERIVKQEMKEEIVSLQPPVVQVQPAPEPLRTSPTLILVTSSPSSTSPTTTKLLLSTTARTITTTVPISPSVATSPGTPALIALQSTSGGSTGTFSMPAGTKMVPVKLVTLSKAIAMGCGLPLNAGGALVSTLSTGSASPVKVLVSKLSPVKQNAVNPPVATVVVKSVVVSTAAPLSPSVELHSVHSVKLACPSIRTSLAEEEEYAPLPSATSCCSTSPYPVIATLAPPSADSPDNVVPPSSSAGDPPSVAPSLEEKPLPEEPEIAETIPESLNSSCNSPLEARESRAEPCIEEPPSETSSSPSPIPLEVEKDSRDVEKDTSEDKVETREDEAESVVIMEEKLDPAPDCDRTEAKSEPREGLEIDPPLLAAESEPEPMCDVPHPPSEDPSTSECVVVESEERPLPEKDETLEEETKEDKAMEVTDVVSDVTENPPVVCDESSPGVAADSEDLAQNEAPVITQEEDQTEGKLDEDIIEVPDKKTEEPKIVFSPEVTELEVEPVSRRHSQESEGDTESIGEDNQGAIEAKGEELLSEQRAESTSASMEESSSVSASGPNSPFHGFCDKEVSPSETEGKSYEHVIIMEPLGLSDSNTPSEESLETGKHVTEQLMIEIPEVVTRCTRSGIRVISPDAARAERRSPRQASPIVLSASGDDKLAKRAIRRKRQESDSSNNSQGRNTPDTEDLLLTSRPSKRKCSENATELIKVCMGLDDPPKRVGTADPSPTNSLKRNSKESSEEGTVAKLSIHSDEEDNHLSDDEPLSELAHRAVRQALKDRTTRIRGPNVRRGASKAFKEKGAGGRRNSTDSPSGLNSRSVTPTRRSGRALVGIKVATPTVLGSEAADLPTRRKTRSSGVTVPDGDGSQPPNRRRPVSKDRR